jgi:translation initiation factor 2B subunit (eIF-2B alpha/beta/delta family)
MEGRKLATMLASGGLEIINTFDTALGLVLSECRAAFMGCDAVGRPGVVNKVGSWLLAVACRELNIPLYALSGTEKIVGDEQLFEFEKHERPGQEVWSDVPKGVRVLNRQFELVPHSLLAGLVTEEGLLREKDIGGFISKLEVHQALKLESSSFV